MVVENEQHFRFSQFEESASLPALDDRSLDMESILTKEDEGSNILTVTGIITALSGLGIFLASNLDVGMGAMKSILVGAGIVGMGIGFGRLLIKLMKRRGLSLPSIKVKRKVEAKSTSSASNISTTLGSFQEKKGGFRKSLTDKIISGVCGGIAESSGISSAIIRAIFIAAFAFTGGTAVLIYLALYFIMRGEETNVQKLIGKRR